MKPLTNIPFKQYHYYPFGISMSGISTRGGNMIDNKFKYNGKELQSKEFSDDSGLEMYYFGARNNDPQIGRWYTVDPRADQRVTMTTYNSMSNNPILRVDPDGALDNPIYDQEGSFLGTDDKGLQGAPIIMKKEDFTQGTKHEDAVKKDLAPNGTAAEYYSAIPDLENYLRFYNHYNDLKNRPDYDGYLTKEEADKWWNGKSGEPLFVDQSKIELPGITTKDFNNKDGASFYKNFIWGLSNTGKVYGTLKLTLLNANTGSIHLGGNNYIDQYDFMMDNRSIRNIATWWGRPGGANDGKDFLIYGYGKAKVPIKK